MSPHGATALAERMAAFLKAGAIYPPTHRRVTSTAREVLTLVGPATEPGTWLRIRFRPDDIVVGDRAIEASGPLIDWMRDAFQSAALAGIELAHEIDRETLTAFADTLRSCAMPRAPDFGAVWPEERSLLRPLELIFSGGPGGKGGGGGGGYSDQAEETPSLAGVAEGELVYVATRRKLLADDWIRARVEALELELSERSDDQDETTRLDLLSSIVADLPAEVLWDFPRSRAVVDEILDALQRRRFDIGPDSEARLGDDSQLVRKALGIARRYFGKSEKIELESDDDNPVGRPEDGEFTHDLEAFRTELEVLPTGRRFDLPERDNPLGIEELQEELLGVYMHTLVEAKEDVVLDRIEECLRTCLKQTTERQIAVIEQYVRDFSEIEERNHEQFWRIADVLVRLGLQRIVIDAGALDADGVAEVFPSCFTVFLDSLTDRPSDRDLLRAVLARIGPERMRDGGVSLVKRGALAEQSRVRKILAVVDATTLPFVDAICQIDEGWARAAVASCLQSLELPKDEASALHCVVPASDLPQSYLSGLCRCGELGESDAGVRRRSAMLLQEFVERSEGRPELVENRLRALRALSRIPSPDVEQVLARVARFRWWFGGKEARRARKVAREALDTCRRRMEKTR